MVVERQRTVKFHFYPCLFSLFLVSLSHLALAMLPYLFPSLPLLSLLPVSALLLLASAAFGRCCRRILRVSASAPALVFFNILFVWGVYNSAIRQGFLSMKDLVLNAEFSLLMAGLYSILSCDPGFIYDSCLDSLDQSALSRVSSEMDEELSSSNVDYEQSTLSMLQGFVIAEASYVWCAGQFTKKSQNIQVKTAAEIGFLNNLVVSTMFFCVLQMSWQVIFLMWHIYCICLNIKTDEWINWRKYPEFQVVIPAQPGQPFAEVTFRNPYDKGFLGNIKDFLLQDK